MIGRTRWASLGAALAMVIGASGLMTASASVGSGERAVFVPITPCRIMDTRSGSDNVGARSTPIGANETHTITARGAIGKCTIPTDAVGLVLNVTVVNGTASSFLTVFPTGVARPLAANLNWVAGQAPTPNAVTVRLAADGGVSFFNLAGTVDVAADVAGYFADHQFDDRYYTKGEVDALLATSVAAQTASVDAKLAGKADKAAGPLILGASSFTEDGFSPASVWSHNFTTGRIIASASACFAASVRLPTGSTVTSVVLHAGDSAGAHDVVFELRSDPAGFGPLTLMASGSTTGATGDQTIIDSTVTSPVIANATNSYFATVCVNSGLSFRDIVINYTLP